MIESKIEKYKVISDYAHLCGFEFECGDYIFIEKETSLAVADGWFRVFDPRLGGDETPSISSEKYLGLIREQYLNELIKRHELRLETK